MPEPTPATTASQASSPNPLHLSHPARQDCTPALLCLQPACLLPRPAGLHRLPIEGLPVSLPRSRHMCAHACMHAYLPALGSLWHGPSATTLRIRLTWLYPPSVLLEYPQYESWGSVSLAPHPRPRGPRSPAHGTHTVGACLQTSGSCMLQTPLGLALTPSLPLCVQRCSRAHSCHRPLRWNRASVLLVFPLALASHPPASTLSLHLVLTGQRLYGLGPTVQVTFTEQLTQHTAQNSKQRELCGEGTWVPQASAQGKEGKAGRVHLEGQQGERIRGVLGHCSSNWGADDWAPSSVSD